VHKVHFHEPPVPGTPIHVLFDSAASGPTRVCDLSATLDGGVSEKWRDLVIVCKPAGIPVHACGPYNFNTITSLLVAEAGLPVLNTVHRLDRLTSGLLFLARTSSAAHAMGQQLRSHDVRKRYIARVAGVFPSSPPCRPSLCSGVDKSSTVARSQDDAPGLLQLSTESLLDLPSESICTIATAECPFLSRLRPEWFPSGAAILGATCVPQPDPQLPLQGHVAALAASTTSAVTDARPASGTGAAAALSCGPSSGPGGEPVNIAHSQPQAQTAPWPSLTASAVPVPQPQTEVQVASASERLVEAAGQTASSLTCDWRRTPAPPTMLPVSSTRTAGASADCTGTTDDAGMTGPYSDGPAAGSGGPGQFGESANAGVESEAEYATGTSPPAARARACQWPQAQAQGSSTVQVEAPGVGPAGFRVGWTADRQWLLVDVGVGAVDPKNALHGPFRIFNTPAANVATGSKSATTSMPPATAEAVTVTDESRLVLPASSASSIPGPASSAGPGPNSESSGTTNPGRAVPVRVMPSAARNTYEEADDVDDGNSAAAGIGRPSVTLFRLLRTVRSEHDGAVHSIVEARPLTGRTHQIRVHLAFIGFPIWDDPVYSKTAREAVNARAAAQAAATAATAPLSGRQQREDSATLLCRSCAEGDDLAELSPMHTHCERISLHSCTYEGRGWRCDCPSELLPPWAHR
jgi:23S rRNA-/tRNA-specific pseudouridylate synthase